jgi:uncharacterized protein (TIGR02271 family)
MMHSSDHLTSLKELGGYEVSREDPDVRGWTVVAADGQRMGKVRDLIVDTDRMKVEYLELDGDGADAGPLRVPVSSAQLDTQQREVVVGGTMSSGFSAADTAAGRADTLRSGATDAGLRDRDRATLRRAEEELRIGKREVQAGEVVVAKHVETERVSQPVTLERERVHVERRPVTEAMTGHVDIGEDEIRVPVVEEELIVEKRPVVKEELVISKERVQDTETVDTELRREEFDVQGTPDRLIDDDGRAARGKGRR